MCKREMLVLGHSSGTGRGREAAIGARALRCCVRCSPLDAAARASSSLLGACRRRAMALSRNHHPSTPTHWHSSPPGPGADGPSSAARPLSAVVGVDSRGTRCCLAQGRRQKPRHRTEFSASQPASVVTLARAQCTRTAHPQLPSSTFFTQTHCISTSYPVPYSAVLPDHPPAVIAVAVAAAAAAADLDRRPFCHPSWQSISPIARLFPSVE